MVEQSRRTNRRFLRRRLLLGASLVALIVSAPTLALSDVPDPPDGPSQSVPPDFAVPSQQAEPISRDAGLDSLPLDDGGAQILQDADAVVGFPAGNVALIDPPGQATRALVESSAPLKPEEGKVPDLSLQSEGGALAPENPIVPVTLPATMADEATLPNVDVGLSVPPAADSTEVVSRDVPESTVDAAVYRGALPDSDVIMAPVSQGLEVAIRLGSALSPEEIPLRLSLPDGAHLEAVSEPGSEVAVVGSDGERLASVRPPSAWDAGGQTVSATMSVSGDTVTLHVPHRQLAEVQYPLMVDPTITEDFWWNTLGCNANPVCAQSNYNWTYHTNAPNGPGSGVYYPSYTPWCGQNGLPNIWDSCAGEWRGLQIYTPFAWFPAGTWGLYYLHAPGTTSYFTYFYASVGQGAPKRSGYEPRTLVGLVRDGGSWVHQVVQTCDFPSGGWCGSEVSIPNSDPTGRVLEFGVDTFQNWTTTDTWRWTRMTGFRMTETDPEPAAIPTLASTVPKAWLGRDSIQAHYSAVPPDSTWNVRANATDPGMGVHRVIFSAPSRTDPNSSYRIGWGQPPGLAGWSPAYIPTSPATQCTGATGSRCPSSVTATMYPDLREVAQGEVTAHVQSFDALGQASADRTVPLWIDRNSPTGTIGGPFVTEARQRDLHLGSYNLHVNATDGAPTDKTSGVRSVVIKVDGTPVQTFNNPDCTTTAESALTCSHTYDVDYAVQTANYAEGEHRLDVVVIDQAGNQSDPQAGTPSDPSDDTTIRFWLGQVVLHAETYTGDPEDGGDFVSEEWFMPAGPRARIRRPEEITTRQVFPCQQSTVGSGLCTELRHATYAGDGDPEPDTWSSITSPRGDDSGYPYPGFLGFGGALDQDDRVQTGLAHSSYLEDWQDLPPGAGTTADVYRLEEREEGSGAESGGLPLGADASLAWRFSDRFGTTADDASGNSQLGTYVGAASRAVTGALAPNDLDGAVELTGSDQHISSDHKPFVNGADRTFEGWAWRNTDTTLDTLISGETSDQGAPTLYLGGEFGHPKSRVIWAPSGNLAAAATWDNAWPGTNRWVHWALVFKETADTAELFINGQSQGQRSVAVSYPSGPGDFRAGAWGGSGSTSYSFDGRFDEFATYQRALTAAEIQSRYGSPPSAYWRLGEDSGTTATDKSGEGHPGTYVGNPSLNVEGAPADDEDDGAVDLNGSSQYVASDFPTRRNLVANPSLELDMTGWGSWFSPASSITRTTSQAHTGVASLKASAQPGGQGVVYGISATAGKYYSAAAQLRGGTNQGLNLYMLYVNSSLQAIRTDLVSVNASGGWTRAVSNGSAFGPAPAGTIGVWMIITNGASTNRDFYVDAAQVELGSSVGPYFDGSSRGARWEGAANGSPSSMGPFSNGTPRTFEGWAKRDTQGSLDMLLGGTTSDQSAPYLSLGGEFGHPASRVIWAPSGNSGPAIWWDDAWLGTGVWVHWALVFDEAADTAELFINGQSKGAKSLSTSYSANPGKLNLGVWLAPNNVANYGFDGQLDEVAVYQRALTQAEIESSARQRRPPDHVDATEIYVDSATQLPTKVRTSEHGDDWSDVFLTYRPNLSMDDLSEDFFGLPRPEGSLDGAETLDLYGAAEIGPIIDAETGQAFQPLYFGDHYFRNGMEFCLAEGGVMQIEEPNEPYVPGPGGPYAVAEELPPEPSADETEGFAGYTLPPPDGACRFGTGLDAGQVSLEVFSQAAESTGAQTWKETYEEAASSPAEPGQPPTATRSVSFNGVDATAYVIPLNAEEASTLVSDGDVQLIINGPAEVFGTETSAAQIRSTRSATGSPNPAVVQSMSYDIQGLLNATTES